MGFAVCLYGGGSEMMSRVKCLAALYNSPSGSPQLTQVPFASSFLQSGSLVSLSNGWSLLRY